VPSVLNEKTLLAALENPFIVNLLQAHQDRQNLYLLLDFLPGGDLRHHISRRKFCEEEAKFLVVCVLLGLRYLHSRGVIHRDIKPENIVLDRQGYARITDLGVARPLRANNSTDTSGTPGYMAP
jgi:protein kinase A